MVETVIRDAARALNPDRPIKMLAGLRHSPRSTAKSWANGRRRAPIVIHKILRDLLKDRQAIISGLMYQLNDIIPQWEREPRRRTGFNEIRERDGPGSVPRDGRNRLGRPKNANCLEKAR